MMALGCSGESGETSEPDRPAKTYEARGVVHRLPAAGTPAAELFIHHEAIPSFESIDGEITGMDAMAMGFPVPEPGLLEGLQVGDKVAFSLQVDWDGSPPLLITALQKLPDDTLLSLELNGETEATDHSSHGAGHHGAGHHGAGHHDAAGHDDASHDGTNHESAEADSTDSSEPSEESADVDDQR